MGTNVQSTDVLSRVIWGTQTELKVVIISLIISIGVGVPLGLFSGYFGGTLDRALVLIMDALLVFPFLLLAIVIAFLLADKVGQGIFTAAIAITVVYIPLYFRVVRNHTISIREEPFVEAARALGVKPLTIIRKYVFFNVVQNVPASRDAQCGRRHPHARGARLPRLRHRAHRRCRMGLRRQPRGLGCVNGHLVDRPLPGSRDRAARRGPHPARRRASARRRIRSCAPGAPTVPVDLARAAAPTEAQ